MFQDHICRLYRGGTSRGYVSSKRRYFYGLALDVPGEATHYADKAYSDYAYEGLLRRRCRIEARARRYLVNQVACKPPASGLR